MKKWLFPTLMLLWQSAALAQQTISNQQGREIFQEAYKYLNGLGTSYDPAKAVLLFKQGAALGDAASLNALGNLYVKGEAGLEKDINSAIEYYKRAGSGGYGAGYYNLAALYKEGKELPQDFRQSALCSRTGSDMGNMDCKKLLAYYYFKGFGVQQNYAQAFNLYREVAQTGNANAQYFVGLCYRNGYGTTVNKEEAKKWLLLAASQGDYQAMHELTAEPNPENSAVYNPALQQQVEKLKNYQEKLTAAGSNDISGIYKGFAVYYDFSGRFVHQVVSLSLSIRQTAEGYTGKWIESDSVSADIKGFFKSNHFNFDPASKYTRSNYYSYRDAEEYQFRTAQLSINYLRDSMYLAGNMQFYSISRGEPGQPIYIVLSKKTEGGSSGDNLQLTISPNPAISDVKATFTLTRTCKVNFEVLDMNGERVITHAGESLLPPGTYSLPIKIQRLASGSYSIRMTTSTGASQTKLIIKP